MWSKLQCHKPYESLKQLSIPKQLWNSISMDFIEKLLLFSSLAHLFVFHVFSKHSILFYIIFDKGLEFVSNLFHSLGITLNMWLHFTLGYYFKGDGQTEYINQTLKQYLCYEMLWTWTIFIFFFLLFSDFIGILFFFSFLFFLVIMKRHVTSQSHDMSHDMTS